MKLKYYLRGLGMGILVSTVILMIVYHTKNHMTDSDVIKRAKELGMVMKEDSLFDETESNNEQTTTKEPSSEQPTTEAPTTEQSTTEQPTTEEPTTKEPVTEEPTTKEPTTQKPTGDLKTVTFTVKDGMYSEAVTDILYNAGIISNKAEFNNFLEKNGYSRIIQNGKHTVNSSMTYEEIAKIITKTR